MNKAGASPSNLIDNNATYWQRVDRNLGWITREQQTLLRQCCVAIAGCGGMGGYLAETLARIGVGHLKIADNQDFDLSNLNRQFAAKMRSTLGKNKAVETAREIEEIISDVKIEVFPDGVNESNVENFVHGANFICDEIEFYELRARILLHKAARKAGIDVFNCNVVGMGTRIFLFTPTSMTVEEFLEADENTKLDEEMIWKLVRRLAPNLRGISKEQLKDWVFNQRKVPIWGGTPKYSTGFLANRLCLQYLKRASREIPPMPAYGYMDTDRIKSYVYRGPWWGKYSQLYRAANLFRVWFDSFGF